MQIAGSTCSICRRQVTFASDGKSCHQCGIVVHQLCDTEDVCGCCGRPFEKYEHPMIDRTRDAVLPCALRPRNDGPAFVALAMVLASLFIVIGFCMLMYVLSHGH